MHKNYFLKLTLVLTFNVTVFLYGWYFLIGPTKTNVSIQNEQKTPTVNITVPKQDLPVINLTVPPAGISNVNYRLVIEGPLLIL